MRPMFTMSVPGAAGDCAICGYDESVIGELRKTSPMS
jgi:hypothetical protein